MMSCKNETSHLMVRQRELNVFFAVCSCLIPLMLLLLQFYNFKTNKNTKTSKTAKLLQKWCLLFYLSAIINGIFSLIAEYMSLHKQPYCYFSVIFQQQLPNIPYEQIFFFSCGCKNFFTNS